jgi:hypothetical protein
MTSSCACAQAVPAERRDGGAPTHSATPASGSDASARPAGSAPAAAAAADAGALLQQGAGDERVLQSSRPSPVRRPRGGGAVNGGDHIELNWSDFMFNMISMCIVYAYFSRASGHGEGTAAVVLCMSVAGADVLLLLVRWLWCASGAPLFILFL